MTRREDSKALGTFKKLTSRYSYTLLNMSDLDIKPGTADGFYAILMRLFGDGVVSGWASVMDRAISFHSTGFVSLCITKCCLSAGTVSGQAFYHAAIISIPLLPLFYYQSVHFTFD